MASTSERRQAKIGEELDFSAAEAYNTLRTNVSFAIPGKEGGKCIGITSPAPQEGKSYTALNLAYAFAKGGNKTLIISADMRKPSLERYLKMPLGIGLSNILSGNAPLNDTVIHAGVLHDNLSIITAGAIPPNPSELIGSEAMEKLLDTVARQFDYIIVDLPPVTSVIDPVAVSKFLDGVVIVIRHTFTHKQNVYRAMNQLEYAGAHVLGFVYNGYYSGFGRYSYRYRYRNYYKKDYYRGYYKQTTDDKKQAKG